MKNKLKKLRAFLQDNMTLILSILAAIAGGGSISYSYDNESSRTTTAHHQGEQVARNAQELARIESDFDQRLRELETLHR